jgi:hypothetical protein
MNQKRSYYAIIPADVRYSTKLSANAKLLYGEITALCTHKGYCYANNKYFKDLYKVSTVTVSRWLAELAENHFIFFENFKSRYRRILLHSTLTKKLIHFNKNDKVTLTKKLKCTPSHYIMNNTMNTTKSVCNTHTISDEENQERSRGKKEKKIPIANYDEWHAIFSQSPEYQEFSKYDLEFYFGAVRVHYTDHDSYKFITGHIKRFIANDEKSTKFTVKMAPAKKESVSSEMIKSAENFIKSKESEIKEKFKDSKSIAGKDLWYYVEVDLYGQAQNQYTESQNWDIRGEYKNLLFHFATQLFK